jgi:hypothetical protein
VRPRPRVFLPWMIAGPLVGCASWMFDGIFIGATRTRDMRNMMAVSFAGYVAGGRAVGAGLGQPRALGGAAGVLRAQGADAWPALPGAGARGGVSRLFVRIIAMCEFSYENSVRAAPECLGRAADDGARAGVEDGAFQQDRVLGHGRASAASSALPEVSLAIGRPPVRRISRKGRPMRAASARPPGWAAS